MDVYVIISTFGWLIAAVGFVWLVVEAFKSHIFWGLACLFIPCALFAWIILHFDRGWKPFILILLGMMVFLFGLGAATNFTYR